jgi:hypothetical protein
MNKPRRFKQHAITLEPIHDVYLDIIAYELAMSRSEVVRLLIEEQVERDPKIGELLLSVINRSK